jgi:hypothetical protein
VTPEGPETEGDAFAFFTRGTDRGSEDATTWSQFDEGDLGCPEPRALAHEHMIHRCVRTWMQLCLGIDVGRPALPASETRLAFLDTTPPRPRRASPRCAERAAWWAEAGF